MTIGKLIVGKVLSKCLYSETQKPFKLGWLKNLSLIKKLNQNGSILVEFLSNWPAWPITRSCVCEDVWKSIEVELHKSL